MTRLQTPRWLAAQFGRLRFRRIVTSNRFIPEVDGFRFIAIFMVVCGHVYIHPVPAQTQLGRFLRFILLDNKRGVYLFFTISGFILALPFARHFLREGHRVNLSSYFRRRLTRLEPPYVLAMVLRFLLLLGTGARSVPAALLLTHLLASLFYVHNLVYVNYSIINPPAWSLEVEVQFYLLAPLLAAVFAIPGKFVRRALLLSAVAVSGFFAVHDLAGSPRLSLTLLGYLQFFLAGFVLADLYLCEDLLHLPALLWDGIGIATMTWILLDHSPNYLILLPFAAIALYMSGFRGYLVRGFFSFAPISAIGGMCYSLYLTHTTVLAALEPYLHRLERLQLPEAVQLLLIFVPCCLAVVLVGGIFYLLIERPCMAPDWPHRLAQKLRGLRVAVPGESRR